MVVYVFLKYIWGFYRKIKLVEKDYCFFEFHEICTMPPRENRGNSIEDPLNLKNVF